MRFLQLYIACTTALLLFVLGGCSIKQSEPAAPTTTKSPSSSAPQQIDHESPAEDPTADLVASMSLTEKIGQMVLVGMDGTEVQPDISSLIKESRVGGIILYGDNIKTASQTSKLVNSLKRINRDAGGKLPLLLSTDQEGGRVSRLPKEITAFPASKSVGHTNDPKYAYNVGAALGEAIKAIGLNTDFAPVLDINTNPKNPVIGDRSFGTTAKLVSSMGVQEMLGIKSQGIIPVVKHFPGHGDTSVDSHLGLPIVNHDLKRLRAIEFVPFQSAIKEGAPVVMVAHILMTKLDPNTPASMSRTVIQKLLRGELKFNGVVITDDMTMGAVGKVKAIGPASVQSVLAGADIILVGHDLKQQQSVVQALTTAAKSGKIPQSVIDASVYRIAKLKQSFSLSDQPASLADVSTLNQHIKAALK
ncbi:beta-N-acetylhexosaminidase [Paenibacillus glycanilyticus]|uniref:beta-N-acetylhexosaminidase n=1 Tax=Paenibacillus glycanilyticus TaxID=126569 RepID=UPI00203AA378|nr:beta-N-acetylhexosaminidase [Paenibacillus glycanilyticus]MCM3628282.1 beta-N-acetylhexosaminidase [Paenibacillus glycanilyticus]